MVKSHQTIINNHVRLLGLVLLCTLAPQAQCREWNIDGRTVNLARVIDQARSKGTITPEQAEQLRTEAQRIDAQNPNLAQQATSKSSVLAFVRKVEQLQSTQAASTSFGGSESAAVNVSQEKRDDLLILQNIRSQLAASPTLSSVAKNIELTVDNRMLTVRGAVTSAAERDVVLAIARQYIGKDHVFDQLLVESK